MKLNAPPGDWDKLLNRWVVAIREKIHYYSEALRAAKSLRPELPAGPMLAKNDIETKINISVKIEIHMHHYTETNIPKGT